MQERQARSQRRRGLRPRQHGQALALQRLAHCCSDQLRRGIGPAAPRRARSRRAASYDGRPPARRARRRRRARATATARPPGPGPRQRGGRTHRARRAAPGAARRRRPPATATRRAPLPGREHGAGARRHEVRRGLAAPPRDPAPGGPGPRPARRPGRRRAPRRAVSRAGTPWQGVQQPAHLGAPGARGRTAAAHRAQRRDQVAVGDPDVLGEQRHDLGGPSPTDQRRAVEQCAGQARVRADPGDRPAALGHRARDLARRPARPAWPGRRRAPARAAGRAGRGRRRPGCPTRPARGRTRSGRRWRSRAPGAGRGGCARPPTSSGTPRPAPRAPARPARCSAAARLTGTVTRPASARRWSVRGRRARPASTTTRTPGTVSDDSATAVEHHRPGAARPALSARSCSALGSRPCSARTSASTPARRRTTPATSPTPGTKTRTSPSCSARARRVVAATWSRKPGVTPRSSRRRTPGGGGHQCCATGCSAPGTPITGTDPSGPPSTPAVRSASHGRRHRHQHQVGAQVGTHVDEQREGEVDVELALVDLVEDDRRHAGQLRVALEAAQQHPGGDDLDARRRADLAVAAHGVPDRGADRLAEQLGQPAGGGAGGDPARLGDHDPALAGRARPRAAPAWSCRCRAGRAAPPRPGRRAPRRAGPGRPRPVGRAARPAAARSGRSSPLKSADPPVGTEPGVQRIGAPEIARAITRRWISEVPSKTV